ncbi:Heparinase II/III-like protein [Corynebacterium faecale]|uniref:heparinase II/III domain-containing protein n=1 Tax=Corynebacterium faecale TaxID=1758466 RepID=UPI0025B55BD9|nr:heparinase II/III family protein [Corynebacterium faecale]WJY91878.1 Heparinase II/III-like protein [Corynebacterium faecale]
MTQPPHISGEMFVPFLDAEIAREKVQTFIRSGTVEINPSEPVRIATGQIWDPSEPRAEGRKAHGWLFAPSWYSAAELLTDDETSLLSQQIEKVFRVWKDRSSLTGSMAYHDETTAQRAMMFVMLLHTFRKALPDDLFELLNAELKSDLLLLQSEEFYAGLNNHGMFQDIALLVATDYGFAGNESIKFETRAFTRLHEYFAKCFTSDGIHTENNPTYHVMVSRYLVKVVEYAKYRGYGQLFKNLETVMAKADLYAAFSVTPFRTFPPISDTKLGELTPAAARSTFKDGAFLGALTSGVEGKLPEENVFVAEESGYAIGRSGWTSINDSYLFFSAAYNADYHKHSDELSIYYAANGHEILAEAGPNGYQYDDPFTQFAFSSFAHNTLIVDGQGLPRTDDKSQLTTLTTNEATETTLDVTGQTGRYRQLEWSRRVIANFSDRSQPALVVIDDVTSKNPRSLTFLWHLGAKVIPFLRGNFIEFYSVVTEKKIAEMQWEGEPAVSVQQFLGKRHPRVQGWKFPEMGTREPSYTIEVEFESSAAQIRWTLRTSDFLLDDRGVTPFSSEWKTYWGEKPVHYLLEDRAEKSKTELAVVFSAVHEIGDFTFNYRNSLKDFDGRVLYILDDFGDQGSYYLSSGRNLAEFRSVQGLIKTLVNTMDLSWKNVFTLGSSKGGTSALLHGVSAGVGHVYAGAPQYLIGNFLEKPHPNILEYLAGGTSHNDVYWSNKIASRILASGVRNTDITVIVGKKDGHYRNHVIPLVDDSRASGYTTELLTLPGAPHSSFGSVFRDFVQTLSRSRSEGSDFILPNVTSYDSNEKELGVAVALPEGASALGQLFNGRNKVGSLVRFAGGTAVWKIPQPGIYRVRVYAELPGQNSRQAFGTKPVEIKL